MNSIVKIKKRMMYFPLDAIKIVKCKNCGSDVPVNANYPINSVEKCKSCGLYDPQIKPAKTIK